MSTTQQQTVSTTTKPDGGSELRLVLPIQDLRPTVPWSGRQYLRMPDPQQGFSRGEFYLPPGGPLVCIHCRGLPGLPTPEGLAELAAIQTGRADGCISCAVIAAAAELDVGSAEAEGRGSTVHFSSEDGKYVRVSVGVMGADWNIYAMQGSRLPWPGFPTKTIPVDFDPASDVSFNFLQMCLEDCLANHHATCQVRGSWLPTRLVRFDSTEFRLVETERETDKSIRYVALSYCWGGDQKLKLKEGGREGLLKGMSLSGLPPLFHDALYVCRKLDISYIWIDALCVIQDSTSDWQRECVLMPEVYRNAYLTIAAGSAASTQQSILRRDITSVADFRRPLTTTLRNGAGERLTDLLLVPYNNTTRHAPGRGSSSHPDPLGTRGWTLQERLLSNRLVYFGLGELEWTCGATEVCECMPEVLRGHNESWRYHSANALTSREHAFRFWYVQVEHYSMRYLTYSKDKLPAVEGLAIVVGRCLATTRQNPYAAGLWIEDLPRGLSWTCNRMADKMGYLTDCQAPSWSWASVDRSVTYDKTTDHNVLVPLIRNCEYIPATPSTSPTPGGHSRAHLTLDAVLMPAWLVPVEVAVLGARQAYIRFQANIPGRSINVDGMLEVTTSQPGIVSRSADTYDEAELVRRLEGEPPVYAVPTVYQGVRGFKYAGRVAFIVLSKISEKPEEFQRIGSLSIADNEAPGSYFLAAGQDPDEALPWSDGDYKTIVIV